MWLVCSQCGDFACEICRPDERFELCESCDQACVCGNCAPGTIGDETYEACACPECDVFGPAANAVFEWKKSGRITKAAVDAAARLWDPDIISERLYRSGFQDNGDVRGVAYQLLLKAASQSERTKRLARGIVERLEADLGLRVRLLVESSYQRSRRKASTLAWLKKYGV
jgi:hypothetical protein